LRLLHVITRLGVGGIELGLQSLIEGLSPRVFEQRILPVRGTDEELGPVSSLAKFVLDSRDPAGGRSFLMLLKAMRQYRPHIVHSCNWGGIEAVLAARIARVPVVIHCEHGYALDNLDGLPFRQRLARRFLYSLADAFFVVSEDLRVYHAKQAWMKASEILLIRNGVDMRKFGPDREVRAQVRQRLRISENQVLIGSVGRLVPLKDYPTLLRAVEDLIKGGLDCSLLLVGSGPEEVALRRQASESKTLRDRVIFTGASKEVSSLLKGMDIFALPSVCEGMSYTLLEAMASGLPIVAMRVGGNAELVQENTTGYLCSAGAVPELASRLKQLAQDPQRRVKFGATARQIVEENFSLDKMLAVYQDLYLAQIRKSGLLVL
jgi:sugar transferase (PEP-CTERM/EpsH1 system associated)